ncbi:MAG: M1 family metallopeptidase [Saprospiraceae bacterium]
MTKYIAFALFFLFSFQISAQNCRFQQKGDYKMSVVFNPKKHQYEGKQTLKYFNNSPDTLYKVFYHLYNNAFQPGSGMDIRSRNISDPDARVGSRINALKKDEIGYLHVDALQQDGNKCSAKEEGTILEVMLSKPILPNSSSTFTCHFEGQVPIQIRRNGRNNKEGVDYSMAQWYPKMCEFDEQGWHSNPYVGREFYGIWSDFDVKIDIDSRYTVAATGVLQDPNEIGYGYQDENVAMKKLTKERTLWHFKAKNVHDFVWAADTAYRHVKVKYDDKLMLHFFYIENDKTRDSWSKFPAAMIKTFDYANKYFGRYPYSDYSFIQGGDGGMEYPMATLITGERNINSLIGVAIHELMHSWYQGMLATNESLYSWMDEGFTTFASEKIENDLKKLDLLPGQKPLEFFMEDTYSTFVKFMKSGKAEPISTHSDHFQTNAAYSVASYVNGSVFLQQLEYVIGKPAFDRGMLRYYDEWKFKHPNPNDFIRVMEKESGLELDWYKEYMVNTTNTIDYKIKEVEKENRKETKIIIERVGKMPMPIDVEVTFKDGSKELWNIPLDLMRGEKLQERKDIEFHLAETDWQWTNLIYELIIPGRLKRVESIRIDPSQRLADMDTSNNSWSREFEKEE